MSGARKRRPRRYLAAWGYQSDSSGDRVEVDVWTVNAVSADLPDPTALPTGGHVKSVLARAGSVVKVEYSGAAGMGYFKEVSPGQWSEVNQQAFAGAARASGGSRTDAGTFREGAEPSVEGPTFDEVLRYGQREVIPVVRKEMYGLGQAIGRDPQSDERGEEVAAEPFNGIRNVVRVYKGSGVAATYVVDGDALVRAGSGVGPV